MFQSVSLMGAQLPRLSSCLTAIFRSYFVSAASLFFCDKVEDGCQRLALVLAAAEAAAAAARFMCLLLSTKTRRFITSNISFSASLDSGAQQAAAAAEGGEQDECRFDFLINAA